MSSWFYLEGKFNGVTEKKTLTNGTNLSTFNVTEEARGPQKASTYSVTAFKETATAVDSLAMGTSVVVKCKLDSRTYKDKNDIEHRATEIKAFALYTAGAQKMGAQLPMQSSNSAFVPF